MELYQLGRWGKRRVFVIFSVRSTENITKTHPSYPKAEQLLGIYTAMSIQIVEIAPNDGKAQKQFLNLPFQIYRENAQWVPPLAFDARRVFQRAQHPFYRSGEAAFFLAFDQDHKPLGRIAVLHNRNYNRYNHEKCAFFYLFECVKDFQVSAELFGCAESWARRQGLEILTGPKGFSTLDGMGLLIKGFEHRPAFGLPYNPPYYPALLEAAGFSPSGDTVSGYLNPKAMLLPEKVRRAADLIQQRRGIRVVRFRSKRDLQKLIPRLQAMYNAALEGTSGNIPLTEEDLKSLADQLLWFADPRLIKILMKDEEMIGFLLAYPDLSAAMQRCRGKLIPFGWLDLLLERKRTHWVNINGAAVVEKYRGLGGTALLFREMFDSIREGGFDHADLVQIGVENERMQLELRGLGIDFYKTHRLYRKAL
jgi:hypothetical protein